MTLLPISALAHNSVVVIPLGGDDTKKIANVIRVAKSGGDFSSVASAVNSVSNSSQSNGFLIFIGPGVFNLGTQPLRIPSFVNIVGSGPEVTRLRGAVGSSSVILERSLMVVTGDNRLSGFSLENENATEDATGIINDAGTLVLDDMQIKVSGVTGSRATAVRNFNGGFLSISDSTLMVEGGSSPVSIGLRNVESVSELENSTVLMVDGAGSRTGISAIGSLNSDAGINLVNVNLAISDSDGSQTAASSAMVSNSVILLQGDVPTQQGVISASSDSLFRVSGSTVTAATNSVVAASTIGAVTSFLSDSRLSGSVGGSPECNFVFTDTDVPLDSNCQPPPIIN